MGKTIGRLAIVLLFACAASACTGTGRDVGAIAPGAYISPASGLKYQASLHDEGPQARPIPTSGVQVESPPGYINFCLRFDDQCKPYTGQEASLVLSPALWSELEKVNDSTNDDIYPQTDERHYGRAEYWTIPTDGYGDCEDSALTKRKKLISAGLSAAALRVAVVLTPKSERHAVLTVTTDKGDFVLDSIETRILSWDKTDYTWLERQDPVLGWVSLRASRLLLASNIPTPTGASVPTPTGASQ